MVRTAFLAALFALSVMHDSAAQQPNKPEIIIGSDKPQTPTYERSCVEVEIGGVPAPALNCLNRKLRGEVDKVQPPSLAAPLDAKSQDTRVGIVNQSALRQQFGSNYGISAIPQRPTAVYVSPLGRH
jgi:hypothetical protein